MNTFKPDIINFSPNFWQGRSGYFPCAIVNHVIDGKTGSIQSANDWFLNENSEVSAHFGISFAGKIYQWVRSIDTAWSNGVIETPDLSLPWLKEAVERKINPNRFTISIEHEGKTGQNFTQEQINSNIRLTRYLTQRWNIPRDRDHFIGHYQIARISRANCPGSTFPYEAILSAL